MRKEIIEYIIRVTGDTVKGASSLTSLIGPATALAAGAAAAGTAFVVMANDFADAIDDMLTLSADTGATIEMINGLRLAAGSTGKSMEDLIPKDIAKRILETSQGTGEAKKGFDALGMSGDIASGKLSSTDEVLREALKRLYEIEDPTERAGIAIQALGEKGTKMLSTFADLGDLDAYIDAANRIAPVTEESIQAMEDWKKASGQMNLAYEASVASAAPLISAIAEIIEYVTVASVAVAALTREMLLNSGGILDLLIPGRKLIRSFEAGNAEAAKFEEGIKALDEGLSALGETASADFDPFATSLVTDKEIEDARKDSDSKAAKALAEQRKAAREAERKAAISDAEQLRQDLLAAMLAGPGENRTTLKLTADIAGDLDPMIAELEEAIQVMVDGMAKVFDEAESARKAEEARIAANPGNTGANGMSAESRAFMEDPAAAFGDALDKELGPMLGPLASLIDVPGLLGSVTSILENLPEAIAAIPLQVVDLIDTLADLPAELIRLAPEIMMATLDAMVRVALAGPEIIVDTLAALFDALPNAIGESIANVMRDIVGELNPFDGDGAFLGTDLAAEKGEKRIFGLTVPGFDTGGEVMATGLAYVHEGERVQSVAERSMPDGGRQRPAAPTRIIVEDRRAKGPYGLAVSAGR